MKKINRFKILFGIILIVFSLIALIFDTDISKVAIMIPFCTGFVLVSVGMDNFLTDMLNKKS